MPRSFPTRWRYLCDRICNCDFCGGLSIVEVEDAERWCRNPIIVAAGSIVQRHPRVGTGAEHFIRVTHVDPSIVIAVRKTVCVGLVLLIVAFIIL